MFFKDGWWLVWFLVVWIVLSWSFQSPVLFYWRLTSHGFDGGKCFQRHGISWWSRKKVASNKITRFSNIKWPHGCMESFFLGFFQPWKITIKKKISVRHLEFCRVPVFVVRDRELLAKSSALDYNFSVTEHLTEGSKSHTLKHMNNSLSLWSKRLSSF